MSGVSLGGISVSSVLSRLRPTPWGELSTPLKIRRVVAIVSQVGSLGMLASALTSESEVGLRADGSTRKEYASEHASEHSDDESVQGDPKVKAQRDQAGEEKQPADSSDASDLSDAPGSEDGPDASDQREAQSGNAAEDSEKAADSAT